MTEKRVSEISPEFLVDAPTNQAKGYKLSELGFIPEDWSVSTVKDISAIPIQNGLFYEPKRKGKGVPLINVGDMYKSAPVNVESLELFDANTNEIKIFKVAVGDLFFTRSSVVPSGIAFCNIYNSKQENVVFDSHLIRVRPNKELVNPNYLYLNCIAKHARSALIASAKTATMTTIDQGAINRCPVLLPPIKEQTAIANALSDVDALIQELEKLIAKKQAIKTATMQQLLTGRTRLPQFAHHPDGRKKGYKPSELGEIPEDWEIVKLGHLAKFFKGSGLPKSELSESGKIKCIHYGQLFTIYGPKIESIISRTKCAGLVTSQENDVLMPTSDVTPNGLATASCITETGVTLGGDILIIRADKQKLNGVFFSYLIKVLRDQVMQLVTGSTVYHLYGSDMAKFEFAIPPHEEQTAIANILSDMDAEAQALEQRLYKTRQIKQGMMQELLTGKTRLVKAAGAA